MEAKDTVMNTGQLQEAVINKPHLPMGQAIAGAQAKITWDKAIREVVEWMEENKMIEYRHIGLSYHKNDETNNYCKHCKWQAQKKVWAKNEAGQPTQLGN